MGVPSPRPRPRERGFLWNISLASLILKICDVFITLYVGDSRRGLAIVRRNSGLGNSFW